MMQTCCICGAPATHQTYGVFEWSPKQGYCIDHRPASSTRTEYGIHWQADWCNSTEHFEKRRAFLLARGVR